MPISKLTPDQKVNMQLPVCRCLCCCRW